VVLALTDEGADVVEPYVEERGLSLRVGIASRTNGLYGVRGIPHSVLIDPRGQVVWRGHPGSLSDGKVKDALKGARKGGKNDFLSFSADLGEEHASALASSPALSALQEQARAGELGKVLAALEAFDVGGNAALEAARAALAERAKAHAALLSQQAESAVKRLDVSVGVQVYETLSKTLAGRDEGAAAAKRLEEIRGDERLEKELEAAQAFERALKSAERLATSKKRKKLEDFAEKYTGTRAGRRAAALASAGHG
jgi:hypothetical protein